MFIKWEKIILKNFMSYGNEGTIFYFDKSPTTLISGKNGAGKALTLDSLLCTPKGFITMKDIKLNDKVASIDGSFSNVIGIWPQGIKDIYRITLKDGKTVDCSGDHLWTGYYTGHKNTNGTYTAKDILLTMQACKTDTHNHYSGFVLPAIEPIDFYEIKTKLPLPPYLLGVLLGDGCLSDNSISITNTDEHIISKCRDIIESLSHNLVTGSNHSYRIVKPINIRRHRGYPNKIKNIIEDLGLFGSHSETKFIPEIYKYSSVQERYELMKGLMDTDGYVSKTGEIQYTTVSEKLCNDINFIIESLGGYCTIKTSIPTYTHNGIKKSGKLVYTLNIKLKNSVKIISLPRKKERVTSQQNYNRIIKTIEYIGDKECQCITVDHPNHLFLTNNFIPTHNSSIIEAFVFAIKGNTYRGSNKQELINTINQKDCIVELHFTKNNSSYVITRGMKPNIFFIIKDGKRIEESASIRDMQLYLETQVLQTSVTGIIKTSILGCDFKPFMAMNAKEKRDLIETILEINVFTEMNKSLKSKIVSFKEDYIEHQNELKIAEGVLEAKRELYEQLRDTKLNNSEKEKQELKILRDRIANTEKNINDKNQILINMTFNEDIDKVKQQISEIDKKINNLDYDNQNKTDEIEKFLTMSGECSECGQLISDDHKESHVEKNKKLIEVNNKLLDELHNKVEGLDKIIDSYNAFLTNKNNLLAEISTLTLTYDHIREVTSKKIKEYRKQIEAEANGINIHEEDYINTKKLIADLKEKDKDFTKRKGIFNLATILLKDDGIKANIVNQYIPILNQSVNYYLQSLNSPIRFNIDKNLEVRLDSRYPGEFTYHSLSMGERQRIDLSMSFAWRRLAGIKNSVNTNLLILDETFDASIDGDGTDDLLAILDDIHRHGVNIFVISHKGGLEDKLRATIRIDKQNGFSKITKEIQNHN